MISKDVISALRLRTCAIGILRVSVEEYSAEPQEPHFKIFGTGFLVGTRIVLTNRHVIHGLTAYLEKESLPRDRRYVAFLRPNGLEIKQTFHEFEKMMVLTAPRSLDVGLISFRAQDDDPINAVGPVETSKNFVWQVGDPIAVYGYAFGENLLKREVNDKELIYRFGPVLQRGFVSAISPYDHAQNVDRVLLDVRTARGMSGAPVFDPQSGLVLALHSSGMEDTVAFGIPINSEMVSFLVATAEANAPGHSGSGELKHVSTGVSEA